tara:strand:- start:444 stop:563 length:120 start_codon:yes stop_codon:yes gene_type:complete
VGKKLRSVGRKCVFLFELRAFINVEEIASDSFEGIKIGR